MIWRRNNRGTRPAAWLAVFAIVLQALLPVMQAPAGTMPAGGDTIAGLDIAGHLCHAAGDPAPDDHGPAPADHRQCCDVCLTVHAIGGFAPPAAPVIAVRRDYGIVVPVAATLVLPRRQVDATQQARAPPILI